MLCNLALFSGFRSDSSVPGGSLAKASSVGANTVNGPGPFNVSTNPAAFTAATNVVKLPAETAVSTISEAEAASADIARNANNCTKRFILDFLSGVNFDLHVI